ncbi:hypothetical protein QBC43DRAFT_350146 [Cladorrhinum sp. PSN259]|nr:hypothetical protein QBC43DRAFT_350146 [Cladorrhinum sp. PSN259]
MSFLHDPPVGSQIPDWFSPIAHRYISGFTLAEFHDIISSLLRYTTGNCTDDYIDNNNNDTKYRKNTGRFSVPKHVFDKVHDSLYHLTREQFKQLLCNLVGYFPRMESAITELAKWEATGSGTPPFLPTVFGPSPIYPYDPVVFPGSTPDKAGPFLEIYHTVIEQQRQQQRQRQQQVITAGKKKKKNKVHVVEEVNEEWCDVKWAYNEHKDDKREVIAFGFVLVDEKAEEELVEGEWQKRAWFEDVKRMTEEARRKMKERKDEEEIRWGRGGMSRCVSRNTLDDFFKFQV